ncbi:hypothetical protein [Psychroserpens sp. NJDZ02]|uniref:hypothetical protein n=1 Tax=Psychroserpens sp. NJDZ02 TaxID=2570561 RepID=UPI0010A7DE9A|nr:hypothetical protein [Psychroserpens sp. NJDZ02]QCE40935.1 hypothetical protein E9099_05715 [Psychroserpens sp. NJDZ02]
MKDLIIKNSKAVDCSVFNTVDLEKLTIQASTVAIPSEIGRLTNLKELRLIDNTLTNLPKELFDLDKTFIFFENNKPDAMREIGLLFFDFQWKKITKEQAIIYLFILQNDTDSITKNDISRLYDALDYRIESVRKNAQQLLNKWLPLKRIEENAVIAILGKFDVLSLNDIAHRLDNVSVNYETKITSKTTHVILCNEPNLDTVKLTESKSIISTEQNFLAWLNKTDVQFLSKKNEENEDALDNVSEMLLSNNSENIELAIQMMKTHGVSKRLLGDLFIFFNRDSNNQKYYRKAKNLFKKNAPKELLTFLGGDHGSNYEIYPCNEAFYAFLKETQVMDTMQIAFALCKDLYYSMSKELKKGEEALTALIKNGILDITPLHKIPEELKELKGFSTLICRNHFNKGSAFPYWFSQLPIARLDLYDQGIDLPENFREFKNLTHLCLPTYLEAFPSVITQIPTLEVLEMSMTQFERVPEEIKALSKLRKIMVFREWDDKFEEIKEQKKDFFPTNCNITRVENKYR